MDKRLIENIREYYNQVEIPDISVGWSILESRKRQKRVVRKCVYAVSIIAAACLCIPLMVHNPDVVMHLSPDSKVIESSLYSDSIFGPELEIDKLLNLNGITYDELSFDSVSEDFVLGSEDSIYVKPVVCSKSRDNSEEYPLLFPDDYAYRKKKRISSVSFSFNGSSVDNQPVTMSPFQFLGWNNGAFVLNNTIPGEQYGVPGFLPNASMDAPDVLYSSDRFQNYNHHAPISYSLKIDYSLTGRLYLESGLSLTVLRSDVRRFTTSNDTRHQCVYTLGLPVGLKYNVYDGSWLNSYLSFGIKPEKVIFALCGDSRIHDKSLQFSSLVGAGIQLNISNTVSIYGEYDYAYYFTELNMPTSRSCSPFESSIQVGVKFHL